MKFVSLFTKTPNYKRFNYEPRFYDQKAEERKEREERIRQELARERGEQQGVETSDYRTRMTGAFHSARKHSHSSQGTRSTAIVRSAVLLFLTLFIMAFLTWGKVALYGLLLVVPLYIYVKFKK